MELNSLQNYVKRFVYTLVPKKKTWKINWGLNGAIYMPTSGIGSTVQDAARDHRGGPERQYCKIQMNFQPITIAELLLLRVRN